MPQNMQKIIQSRSSIFYRVLLSVGLIVPFFAVSFKPGYELSDIREYLVMELKSSAFDFDELLDWSFVSVHVNQHEILRIFGAATEIVMDQGRVFAHFDFGSLLNLINRLSHELSVRSNILHQTVHRSNVIINHFVQTVV